jgi:hypothetical protein
MTPLICLLCALAVNLLGVVLCAHLHITTVVTHTRTTTARLIVLLLLTQGLLMAGLPSWRS